MVWRILVVGLAVLVAGIGAAQDVTPPGVDPPPKRAGASTRQNESNPIRELEVLLPHEEMLRERHAERMTKLTDERVLRAMKLGADALLKQITADCEGDPKIAAGKILDVEEVVKEPAMEGALPMSIYALLVVGRAMEDDRLTPSAKTMAKPIAKMMEIKPAFTYTMAAQASALSMLPAKPEVLTALTRTRGLLLTHMYKDGAFGYVPPNKEFANLGDGFRDNSNGQFALLGMWACDESGAVVPETFWKIQDQMWRSRQLANGGWAYLNYPEKQAKTLFEHGESSQTMTAAGVASLYVTASRLNKAVQFKPRKDAALENGIANLERNFDLMRTYMGQNPYYSYAIERVARASGRKFFGKLDWFREGAAELVATQTDGFWHDVPDAYPYGGTAFALLFLARGGAPVAFNKLQYPGPWDARPQDVGNLTRWIEKRNEKLINWEIVDVDSPIKIDWADAPILVITGHGDPNFTDAQIQKLRDYVNTGGIIFSTADGADNTFSELIKTKYAPMIAGKQYEMRVLPKDHPIYTLDIKAGGSRETPLWGVSNGARELWIHCPRDMGASWQAQLESAKENWELPTNILTYASGRAGLRRRLESLWVPDPEKLPRQKMTVSRIKYAGNWDPEPGAWVRFARNAAYAHDTTLSVATEGFSDLDARRSKIAHVTGATALAFTEAERAGLKKYFTGGGFLIADATGGSKTFVQSLEAELGKAMTGIGIFEVDLEKHPVTTGNFAGGTALKNLEVRRFCLTPENIQRKMKVYEILWEKKVVGLLFDGDVTSGLLGASHWGVIGYAPQTAESLMWNALQFAGMR
jgi:hypothetical protein